VGFFLRVVGDLSYIRRDIRPPRLFLFKTQGECVLILSMARCRRVSQRCRERDPTSSMLGANLEPDAGFQEAIQETLEAQS
jgi:hypothetical protein